MDEGDDPEFIESGVLEAAHFDEIGLPKEILEGISVRLISVEREAEDLEDLELGIIGRNVRRSQIFGRD
jgi:hypothetical protein